MQESLGILQNIATEIANLRLSHQCHALLILCQGSHAIVPWETQPLWIQTEAPWLEIDGCIVATNISRKLAKKLLLAILEARRQGQRFFDTEEWIRAHG